MGYGQKNYWISIQASEYPYDTYEGVAILTREEAEDLQSRLEERADDFLSVEVREMEAPTVGVGETLSALLNAGFDVPIGPQGVDR